MGIFAFDVIGLMTGFFQINHAAHLGGFLFGVFYHYFGLDILYKIPMLMKAKQERSKAGQEWARQQDIVRRKAELKRQQMLNRKDKD